MTTFGSRCTKAYREAGTDRHKGPRFEPPRRFPTCMHSISACADASFVRSTAFRPLARTRFLPSLPPPRAIVSVRTAPICVPAPRPD